VESTIVDCTGDRPVIARLGGVPREEIERVLGHPVAVADQGTVVAPGTLAAHYAPRATVLVVDADAVAARVAGLLGAGCVVGVLALAGAVAMPPGVVVLASPADVDEYAQVLYRCLRAADARGVDTVVVVPPPAVGLGAAVGDRVRRAAAAGDRPR
jgi:L-threonylcarbamoyladenylate synthase